MKFWGYFKEPAFINFLQIVGYGLAVVCGLLAATNGLPNIITFQLGSVLSVVVGSMLVGGGIIGAWAVYQGLWALERIAIWITGLGYGALLIPTLGYALTPGKSTTSTIWLIVALEIAAIIDSMKRYRRIDWAYLDPAK
jgi:hypothetical protein